MTIHEEKIVVGSKFIQLAVTVFNELVALDDEGQVWKFNRGQNEKHEQVETPYWFKINMDRTA